MIVSQGNIYKSSSQIEIHSFKNNFAKFARKHLSCSLYFIKGADLAGKILEHCFYRTNRNSCVCE